VSGLPACSVFFSSSAADGDGALLRCAIVDACRVRAWALRGSDDDARRGPRRARPLLEFLHIIILLYSFILVALDKQKN
jgi:hypothetical protein